MPNYLSHLKGGQNTGSGVGEFLLIAPREWFETIAVPVAPFAKAGDKVLVKDPHVFKAAASPNITALAGAVTKSADAITAIAVANGGKGYVTPPAVTITGGSGTGATATAVLTNGVVTSVVITNGGSGYTGNPTVTFAAAPVAVPGFIQMQLIPRKNKLDAKTTGDIGLQKGNVEYECFVGGSFAQMHETLQALRNTPCIALVPEAKCDAGFYYQLGDECQSAWFQFEFGTGTTGDGAKGATGKLMFDGEILLYDKVSNPPPIANWL